MALQVDQAALLQMQQTVLSDCGVANPGTLSFEEAHASYYPSVFEEPPRPSPRDVREWASDDYVSPLWPASAGIGALVAGSRWEFFETFWSAVAACAAVAVLACLVLRQRAMRQARSTKTGFWREYLAQAVEQWRALEVVRRMQHRLAVQLDGEHWLSNAGAAHIALIRSALPEYPVIRTMHATDDALSLQIVAPDMDSVIPSERSIELKNDITTRNIPSEERGRMFRDFLCLYHVRMALECLRAVPSIQRIEIASSIDWLDVRNQKSETMNAVRLLLYRSELDRISLDSSASTLAAQLDFEIACTQKGELRPLNLQEQKIGGNLVPFVAFVKAASIEDPPTPAPLELTDQLEKTLPALYAAAGVVIGCIAGYNCVFEPTPLGRAQPPHVPTPAREVATVKAPKPALSSVCGVGAAPSRVRDAVEWSRYSCRSPEDFPAGKWRSCLARPEYSETRGTGCPGSQRCCPPD